MKKKNSVVLVIIVAVALCVSAWFYGYHNRKSNDNLPTLTAIAEMSESDVNSLLVGYKINQLREVWEEPNYSEDSTDYWQMGDVTLVVGYKNNGVVVVCGIDNERDVAEEDSRIIVGIRDRYEEGEVACADAEEIFYEDENNLYYFGAIKSHCIIVTYKDGSSEDIVTALQAGRATIADLDEFGIEYQIAQKSK